MADMIEKKISDPEPWTNKILCRYREAPPIKQFLRDGEDRVLVAEITRLRQLLSEAEKREREARAKALEEASAYHDDLAAQHAASSKEERHHVARDNHAAFCIQHQRHAAAIRALQSEER